MSTSVHDPEPRVKRGGQPLQFDLPGMRRSIPDSKILEVARFVRASWQKKRVPADPDDLFQEAALAALETRHRYGDRIQGNAFNYLATPAFRRTKTWSLRTLSAVSVSERHAGLAVEMQTRVPIQNLTAVEQPEVLLRGERQRQQQLVELVRGMNKRDRRLIAIAVGDPEIKLDGLATRMRLGKPRTRKILRSVINIVGVDPAFANVRRVISPT